MSRRCYFFLIPLAAVLLLTPQAGRAELELTGTETETEDGVTVTVDSEFQDLDYRVGDPVTLTVTWQTEGGSAEFVDFQSRFPHFTPQTPEGSANGTPPTVLGFDESSVTVEFAFTELKPVDKPDAGIGNAHFFLVLAISGEEEPEEEETETAALLAERRQEAGLVRFGVNVHVEGSLTPAAPCEVSLQKLISCDGGETFGTSCVGSAGIEGVSDPGLIQVLYVVENTGELEFEACELTESNPGIIAPAEEGGVGMLLLGEEGDAPLPAAGGEPVEILEADAEQLCTAELAANEPDTATVTCSCIPPEAPENGEFDEEELTATATASADFECGAPGLSILTECLPQSEMINDVAGAVTNETGVALTNCQITADVAPGECPAEEAGEAVPVDPSAPFDLSSDEGANTQEFTAAIEGLEESGCLTASVTCELPDGNVVTSTADDLCETPGGACPVRGPGFWQNRTGGASQFLPITSCGFEILSAEELSQDLCFDGRDALATGTSPQQLQLVRMCATANLNLAAAEALGGNCEAENPGLTERIAHCCEEVCTAGLPGPEIGASGCIGLLSAFNDDVEGEEEEAEDEELESIVGLPEPGECTATRGDGFVNGRELGPPNGNGRGPAGLFRSRFRGSGGGPPFGRPGGDDEFPGPGGPPFGNPGGDDEDSGPGGPPFGNPGGNNSPGGPGGNGNSPGGPPDFVPGGNGNNDEEEDEDEDGGPPDFVGGRPGARGR